MDTTGVIICVMVSGLQMHMVDPDLKWTYAKTKTQTYTTHQRNVKSTVASNVKTQ